MSFHEMSTDCRIFLLSNVLMKVSDCVPDIICIAQITWETVNNWWLDFFGFKILSNFLLTKTGSNVGTILWLRSHNCFRTAFAATWSLNGRLILIAQLRDLSHKVFPTLQPVFVSKKLGQDLEPKEIEPSIVNRLCVVYRFSCDLCDADYVGYTARQLHQYIAKHKCIR